ncbi:MAG: hypothetical protein WBP03_00360 [Candidatus Saccharimonadales bacterium]
MKLGDSSETNGADHRLAEAAIRAGEAVQVGGQVFFGPVAVTAVTSFRDNPRLVTPTAEDPARQTYLFPDGTRMPVVEAAILSRAVLAELVK